MTSAQHSLITVQAETAKGRLTALGVFDARSGGETSAETSKHRSGGLGAEIVFTSLPTQGDVTITRAFVKERDHELARTLRKRVGRAKVVVSEAILDQDGVAWGSPVIWTGILTGVNAGDSDSTSSDPRLLELTVSVGSTA